MKLNEIYLGDCLDIGVGCKKLNRDFIMIEKDLDFYNISLERMKNIHLE
jgi:DNA modification methylase